MKYSIPFAYYVRVMTLRFPLPCLHTIHYEYDIYKLWFSALKCSYLFNLTYAIESVACILLSVTGIELLTLVNWLLIDKMEQNIQLQFFTLAMFSSRPSVCSLDRDILGCWVPSFNQLILIRKCTPIWLGWQAERVVLGLQAQRITFQYKSYEILLQHTVFININHMSEWY